MLPRTNLPQRCLAQLTLLLTLTGLLVTVAWLALPSSVGAAAEQDAHSPAALVRQQTPPAKPPSGGTGSRDIEGGIKRLFTTVATTGVNIVGAVFTAVAVIGGLLIITAGSNGRRSEMGQAFLWSGVIGVFIVLMAATFSEELIALFGGS